MANKPKKKASYTSHPQSEPSSARVARWVADMHQHFQDTGTYRVQDIQRVLGDPRDSVEIRLDTGIAPAASRTLDK